MRDRIALGAAALTAALHLAFAGRYDTFRDELYFIVCGRHPAFGYADQPPLVPLIAAAFYAPGGHTWLLRVPAVAAAAMLVWLVVRFVRLLGGRDGAALAAAVVAALAPMLAGLTATLNTTTFEPLAWTAVAYGIARAVVAGDRRALLWSGFVAGLAMEAKYALPLWLAGLAVGLVLTPARTVFRARELWIGVGVATAIALPSVVWQAAHGWPFVELVRNASLKDAAVAPLAYAVNQILVMNPLFAPIWIAGLAAPFVFRDLRPLRFVPLAYAVAACAIVAGGGKDYYLAPAYPSLVAIGAVAFERAIRPVFVRGAYLALGAALSLVVLPLALPILAPERLSAYQRALHLVPAQQERDDAGAAFPSTFADMLGWRDFTREVGTAYASLTPDERRDTAVLVDNYGEAAALDIYGAPYGLPPALSGHNQYYFWNRRGQTVRNVLRVQFEPERLAPYCARMRTIATTHSPYARSFENGKTIAYCGGLHPPIDAIWPLLKHFI